MLRRMMVLILLLLVGAVAPTGAASALPITTPYPAPSVPAVVVAPGVVEPGGFFILSGSGFLPGEPIDITVEYSPLSGLRRAAALVDLVEAARPAAAPAGVVADASGAFSTPVLMEQSGLATITATGRISGFSIVTVVQVGSVPAAGAPAPAPAPGGSDGSGGVGAPGAGDAGRGSGSNPLASTGVGVAGPLAVGAGLLALGLLLLFFGARMVIRRRVRPV